MIAVAHYPEIMTPALAKVLGQPNFVLHPLWMALREVGVQIEPRYEAEQAAALHFLIPLVLEHGDGWRKAAADRLLAMKAEHVSKQAGEA